MMGSSSESATHAAGRRLRVAWMITGALAASAAVYQGHHLSLASQDEDTNHLETPLALAVAGQLTDGPGTLYGPYSGANPRVLVHSPLYYRLAGLGAWVLTGVGVDPVAASLAAGRMLSLAGLALVLVAAYRIAQLDGGALRAGAWAALLVAGSPVAGSLPVTVRADMLGVGLQGLGVAWALRAIRDGGARGLLTAYVALGLAVCVKQHAVAAPVVTSLLTLAAWRRERVRTAAVAGAHAIGLAVVGAYYGIEEVITSGRMHQAAFALPAAFRTVAPASWEHVAEVAFEMVKRSVGLVALAGACLWAGPRRALGGRLDAVLGLYLLAETALAVVLCRNSTGAWVNYFMPAIVFACLWVGRALDRVAEVPATFGRVAPLGLALLAFAGRDAQLAYASASHRADDRALMRLVLSDPRIASRLPGSRYFVGEPSKNRLHGNLALAHDEWLYGRFEAVGDAEPRAIWLGGALVSGPVEVVVVPDDGRRAPGEVAGLDEPLSGLGFQLVGQFGPYTLWERRPGPDIVPIEPGAGPGG